MKLNIALPVLNEEQVLRQSVQQVLLAVRQLPDDIECVIVIADNGSSDRTAEVGSELAAAEQQVELIHEDLPGKGRAVFAAWQKVPADIYAFMDIDLSTDLTALAPLVQAVAESRGMSVGSRYHPESQVIRSPFRRWYSAGYRWLLQWAFATAVTDAPCGFKAISRGVWMHVGPQIKDRRWFFDTELVIRAERAGFVVREIPVVWREQITVGRKSRVNVPKLCWEYLCCVLRLKKDLR